MSKTEKPSIRFHGFDDTWEQRKLGDNIAEYTEKTTINNQYPVLTSSRRGIFFQTDYYDGNQIASADNTGYMVLTYKDRDLRKAVALERAKATTEAEALADPKKKKVYLHYMSLKQYPLKSIK